MKSAFRKVSFLFKEGFYLVREHKLYLLMPVLLLFGIIGILFFHLGPKVLVTFIYAGV
jgi:hypothetical protein